MGCCGLNVEPESCHPVKSSSISFEKKEEILRRFLRDPVRTSNRAPTRPRKNIRTRPSFFSRFPCGYFAGRQRLSYLLQKIFTPPQEKKWLCVGLLSFFLLFPGFAYAADKLSTQRRAFLIALSDLQRHEHSQFLIIADHLRTYPLYPYLIYADLALHLPEATSDQLEGYLKTYQDTPLASHLRALWLNQLASRAQWQAFLTVYQPSKDLNLQCDHREALWQTGQKNQALDQLSDLLGKSAIPKSCLWVMGQALASGNVGQPLLWDAIARALQNNNFILANQLNVFLPLDQKKNFILWRETAQKPLLILNPQLFKAAPEFSNRIALTAIEKLTHKDPLIAANIWMRVVQHTTFDTDTQSKIIKIIALGLAENHDALAEKWLAAIPENQVDMTVQEWRIRTQLWQQNWPAVEKTILALPLKDQHENAWRYWLARALNAQGQTAAAQNIYRDLSLHGDFYGQLASLHLNQLPLTAIGHLKVNMQQINAIASLPGIQRAYELYQLQWLPEAAQEWRFTLSHLPEEDYLAAAELAIHWGWFERGIATVNLINDGTNIPLRFPLAYRIPILQAAQRNHLNPAWLFALIRQESLFTPDAHSSAGAVGLMQLLPGTASLIANRLHMPFSPIDLTNASTNISLGSIFLKKMALQFHDNEVLATAAYNAGPNRVKMWLPPRAIPADIWVENIPYHETRNYVKNILTSTTFYEKELGLSLTLAQKIHSL